MVAKKKSWKYHESITFMEDNVKYSVATQLYKIGIYLIINGEPGQQMSTTPAKMVAMARKLRKAEKDGKISELTFGREITVIEENGFYVEFN